MDKSALLSLSFSLLRAHEHTDYGTIERNRSTFLKGTARAIKMHGPLKLPLPRTIFCCLRARARFAKFPRGKYTRPNAPPVKSNNEVLAGRGSSLKIYTRKVEITWRVTAAREVVSIVVLYIAETAKARCCNARRRRGGRFSRAHEFDLTTGSTSVGVITLVRGVKRARHFVTASALLADMLDEEKGERVSFRDERVWIPSNVVIDAARTVPLINENRVLSQFRLARGRDES